MALRSESERSASKEEAANGTCVGDNQIEGPLAKEHTFQQLRLRGRLHNMEISKKVKFTLSRLQLLAMSPPYHSGPSKSRSASINSEISPGTPRYWNTQQGYSSV